MNCAAALTGSGAASVLVTVPRTLAIKILRGEKRVEFRKVWPRRPVRDLWFCEKASGGLVVARADVAGLEVLGPAAAWEKYGEVSGVAERELLAYAGERAALHCVVLGAVQATPGMRLSDVGVDRAPQNYAFLSQ